MRRRFHPAVLDLIDFFSWPKLEPRKRNGRSLPTKAIVAGLAKEFDSDVQYLEKLAEEIRKE
jgi:hypothetical protein